MENPTSHLGPIIDNYKIEEPALYKSAYDMSINNHKETDFYTLMKTNEEDEPMQMMMKRPGT